MITIDAMGTQRKIAEQIAASKGEYILSLKKNQGKAHEAVMNYVDEHITNDFQDVPHERLEEESLKSSHGRIESRTYIQFEVPSIRRPRALEGIKDVWAGGVSLDRRRPGENGYPLLSEQPRLKHRPVLEMRSQSLGDREYVPLEPRRNLSGRRAAFEKSPRHGKHGLDSTLHTLTAQAEPGQDESRHETTLMRLELGLPPQNPWNSIT